MYLQDHSVLKLPFNSADLFNVFGLYNSAVWPWQTFVYVLAFLVLFLYLKRHPDIENATFILLSLLWLVNGILYHLMYFSAINKSDVAFYHRPASLGTQPHSLALGLGRRLGSILGVREDFGLAAAMLYVLLFFK